MLRYVIKLNCFVLFVLMFICLDTQLKSGVWASEGGPGNWTTDCQAGG